MPSGHPNPTTREVERQLEQMLADDAFSSRPQQAKLFEFVVRTAMRGEEVTEKYIREKVFPSPPYKPESNIARGTIDLVKKILADYYAGDGKDDPVIIALPQSPPGKRIKFQAGQAYKPLFSYNRRSEIAKGFAIAHHLLRGGPSQVHQAMWQLDAIARIEPDHPDVLLGFAEAVALEKLSDTWGEGARGLLSGMISELMEKLDPVSANSWRAHMVRGLLHYCDGELDAAREAFDIALRLDRPATISRGYYVLFLFATGDQEEALHLIAIDADERADAPQVHAVNGIYLCKANQFEQAEHVFSQALALDRNCWIAHYGMTLLYLSTDRREQALEQAQRLESLLEREDFELMMRQLGIELRER